MKFLKRTSQKHNEMSRRNLPEYGDLVIGTVIKIYDHGVYVSLDEYTEESLQAYCHVSEVSNTWVRNIRNVMRIGKKVVGRVMRIRENQIDISIKRVSESLKREKVQEIKHYKTAITLLEMGTKKIKVDFEVARTEVEDPCTNYYGSFYVAFEEALFKAESAFLEAGVSEEWAIILTQIAKDNLSIPTVEIVRDVELICWEKNGIIVIRDVPATYKNLQQEWYLLPFGYRVYRMSSIKIYGDFLRWHILVVTHLLPYIFHNEVTIARPDVRAKTIPP